MPISDFWVQALLSSTNPSPVPSTTSTLSSNDENLDSIGGGFLPTNNSLLWNPTLIQQFLAMYQIQAANNMQNMGLNNGFNLNLNNLNFGLPQKFSNNNINNNTYGKVLDPTPTSSRKRQLSELPTSFADPQPRRHKSRKLGEDTVTSSPVSGMFIKEESAVKPVEELQKEADLLDETAAYVEVTDESRQKIGEIPNVIGDCVCRLCKVKYDDVFKLAQHKCPRIAHEEYKCPDCEKVFSCPANLASHRRWHKPKAGDPFSSVPPTFTCQNCYGLFPTKKLMKTHSATCNRSPLQSLLARVIPPIS